MKAAIGTLDGLLDSLATIGVDPTGASVKDWKRRLKAIDSKEALADAVLSLEADVNGLGSGLPPGALPTRHSEGPIVLYHKPVLKSRHWTPRSECHAAL